MSNYSKRVHCSECGETFPRSETQLLSFGKTVLRLCMNDYEPKRKAQESNMFAAAQKAEELQRTASENIANRGGKKER